VFVLRSPTRASAYPKKTSPAVYRVFQSRERESLAEEGTGLGLVIVKEILDFLGGSISVKSKVGEGTR